MFRTGYRVFVLASIALGVGLTFWLSLGAGAAARPRAVVRGADGPCQVQPGGGLQLNTVVLSPGGSSADRFALVKSVAMEKEIFFCQPGQIRDHETFVELVELKRGQNVTTVDRGVLETVCVKDFTSHTTQGASGATCVAKRVDLVGPDPTPFQGCLPSQSIPQPNPAVQMNTVALGNLTKTVKVEKEVLDCSKRFGNQPGTVAGDVYLFTEIVEGIDKTSQGLPTLRPLATGITFEGVICFKHLQLAQIASCETFQTGP